MHVKSFAGKLILASVFSVSLTLAGCSSGVTGKWVNPKNPNDYYEFKSDGTWFAQDSSGRGASGTYEAADTQITLKMGNGVAAKATIKDKVMTTPDGKSYQKQ